jgi:hypothetical protein
VLRWALMVRDANADVPLLLTYTDRDTRALVQERLGHCDMTSLADIVAPVIAGPLVDESFHSLEPNGEGGAVATTVDGDERTVQLSSRRRLRALAGGVFKPHDRSAALLLYGAMGLLVVLVVETVSASIVLDQHIVDSFYGSAKTLVTVDPNDAVTDGPSSYKVVVSVLMLIALVFEAFFTAGIVNRLIDRRLTGLWGSNAVPRERHVIVVGLGQVGLRLCMLLRECGVPVVAVDDRQDGENVGRARRAGLPVVIGRGADPSVLARLSLDRALSLAAVADDDLENIEIGLSALSLRDDLRVVLRVGDGELANETESLFELGIVRDAHRIAAAEIADSLR